MKCTECGYNCHERCQPQVPWQCKKRDLLEQPGSGMTKSTMSLPSEVSSRCRLHLNTCRYILVLRIPINVVFFIIVGVIIVIIIIIIIVIIIIIIIIIIITYYYYCCCCSLFIPSVFTVLTTLWSDEHFTSRL